jgi:hypothetical protein
MLKGVAYLTLACLIALTSCQAAFAAPAPVLLAAPAP